jgi:hypothetical protein
MADDGSEIGDDRAVVDRIVDGRTAVLLVGPDEVERIVAVEVLPEGAGEGTWVVLEHSNDPADVRLRIDEQLTQQRFDDLTARLDAIRRTRRGGRFER